MSDVAVPRRRSWAPEASLEAAAALRTLAARPWLVAGRDDEVIAAVRRNLDDIRDVLGRLGWVLVVEPDLVRLRKSPPARRSWSQASLAPRTWTWFFLLVAAAERMPRRCGLAELVTAARAAAGEAGVEAVGDLGERRATVAALKALEQRGVVVTLDGDADDYVNDEEAGVLLGVHHTRLLHVIANFTPGDPAADPNSWLEVLERQNDIGRAMRRRLVDDTVLYNADLTDEELAWLRRRLRDDLEPVAGAFGLHVERRSEGAALVVPDDAFRQRAELGDLAFPGPGTVPHAALLCFEHVEANGRAAGPFGPGWLGITADELVDFLADLVATGSCGAPFWKQELAESPRERLLPEVQALLAGNDLVRVVASEEQATWWFAPAIARWRGAPRPAPVARATAASTVPRTAPASLSFEEEATP